MTSLQKIRRKNGVAWRVQYMIRGTRRTLYLGVHYSRAHAEEIDAFVRKIVDALAVGVEPDAATRAWLDRASPDLRERLERAGLLEKKRNIAVPEIWRLYVASPAFRETKPTTQQNKVKFFNAFTRAGGAVAVRDLTREKLDAIRAALDAELAEATRASALKTASAALNWAVERGIIDKNPIEKYPKGSLQNKTREYFVDRETASKVMENCRLPAARVAFALYRFGGLRRGEAFLLKWSDVKWERGRIYVTSPKTERVGKGSREIPLFPALRRELERARRFASPEAVFVVEGASESNILKTLKAAARRAGVEVWPRFIQNLRASCANEIIRDHNAEAESAWIGHDSATARKHYLTVLDSDFEKALRDE